MQKLHLIPNRQVTKNRKLSYSCFSSNYILVVLKSHITSKAFPSWNI